MTIKETYQGVEALFHNLNSLQSRSGGQLKVADFKSDNIGETLFYCFEKGGVA